MLVLWCCTIYDYALITIFFIKGYKYLSNETQMNGILIKSFSRKDLKVLLLLQLLNPNKTFWHSTHKHDHLLCMFLLRASNKIFYILVSSCITLRVCLFLLQFCIPLLNKAWVLSLFYNEIFRLLWKLLNMVLMWSCRKISKTFLFPSMSSIYTWFCTLHTIRNFFLNASPYSPNFFP